MGDVGARARQGSGVRPDSAKFMTGDRMRIEGSRSLDPDLFDGGPNSSTRNPLEG